MGPRLRVLKVMPGVDPCAGAEQSFLATAPALIERGVDLHLAVLTDRQGLVPTFERAGGVVHDLSSSSSMVQRYRAISKVISAIRPDVVHATLWEAAVPAQLAARRSGSPVLVTWANVGSFARDDGSGTSWKLRTVHQVDRVLAGATHTHFHAVTPGVAEVNAAGLAVPVERVHVVERGRPDVDDPVTPAAAAALRSELGIGPSDRVVVNVGRQEPQKDQAGLVRAAALAAERVEGLVVLIVGRDGLASDFVRDAIQRHDTRGTVRLLGHRDDVPALLALSDAFVMSSRYEGAAGAVIEAMRAGLPIVATDVVGQRGILEAGENALLVPVSDPTALADALVTVLSDRKLAERLGAAAERTYRERFTIERAVDGLELLYRQLANRPGAAA